MKRLGRWNWLLALLFFWPMGCGRTVQQSSSVTPADVPIVRVRLLEGQQQITLWASDNPTVRTASHPEPRGLSFPRNTEVPLVLSEQGWRLGGNLMLGTGELTLHPASDGSLRINGQAYRGGYRLVPVGPQSFDVVNDVDVDSYLMSVVSRELLWNWHDETYKAQAIAARTYALFEARVPRATRHFDLHADVRSQVYGGMAAETGKSRRAVTQTAGIVLAHGAAGQERIFKAYFSSCCGGITQSAADAFNEPYLEALSDQDAKALCSGSPRFSWGPVEVKKDELTRRFRLFGARRHRPERDMELVESIRIEQSNRFGRPVRFRITDAAGTSYIWSGEELRWAVNTDAGSGETLYSSFFKLINEPDAVRFVEGHGWGHGVGMCQWCAQRRAELGWRHEDIALTAYPRSRLVRAY